MKFGHLSYILAMDVNANRNSDMPYLLLPPTELVIREHLVLLNAHRTHDRRDVMLKIFKEMICNGTCCPPVSESDQ